MRRLRAFECQLAAADSFKLGKIGLSQLPKDIRSDMLVVVSQYIANACDFHPRNIGMPGFQLSGEVATRFRYDLEAALDKPLPLPVVFEGLEGHVMQ